MATTPLVGCTRRAIVLTTDHRLPAVEMMALRPVISRTINHHYRHWLNAVLMRRLLLPTF